MGDAQVAKDLVVFPPVVLRAVEELSNLALIQRDIFTFFHIRGVLLQIDPLKVCCIQHLSPGYQERITFRMAVYRSISFSITHRWFEEERILVNQYGLNAYLSFYFPIHLPQPSHTLVS